jgi:hypothetical protein
LNEGLLGIRCDRYSVWNCVPRVSWVTRGTNTPSHTELLCGLLNTRDLLEVLVAHFAVVPGRMMLGEVVSQVEFSWGPLEVELALSDSIFHPPIAHIERFRKLLAHFGIEDALGSVVVGVERCCRLWVTEFFEGSANRDGVFAANEDTTGFGFGSRSDDVFDRLTEDVESAIYTVAVLPTEVIVDRCSAARLGLDEIGGVGSDFEQHITCIVADDGIGIIVEIVHEHVGDGDGVGSRLGLLGSDFVEGRENAWVDCAAVVEEGAADGLDAFRAIFVEKRGRRFGGWVLGLTGTVDGGDPRMRGVLFLERRWMVEFGEGAFDVARH